MKITGKVVEHVAHLARLELGPEEIDLYTQQLDRILAYMDQLNSLDTTGIEPTTHAIPLVNVFREDRYSIIFRWRRPSVMRRHAIGPFFKVPPIIETD